MLTQILVLAHLALIQPQIKADSTMVLASRTISLENRYGNTYVNNVFKDNILLTLNYMNGEVKSKDQISWEKVEKPAKYEFTLNPGEQFTFHDQTLPEYKGNVVKTTNAHFNYSDGFKSDGYLMGDGVCHLASLFYWVAKDANLLAISPTNHDFAVINEIPKEYGVSIYYMPENLGNSGRQNLYITNNLDKPITFVFEYNGDTLSAKVLVSN